MLAVVLRLALTAGLPLMPSVGPVALVEARQGQPTQGSGLGARPLPACTGTSEHTWSKHGIA